MKHFIVIGNILRKVRVQAIVEGAKKFGLAPLFFRLGDEKELKSLVTDHDIAFGVSVGMRASDAYAKGYLEALGINTLVLDLGYFSRAKGPADENGYNQLGINRLCWIAPITLPNDRLEVHKLRFLDRVKDNGVALVLGQVPGDTQHGLTPGDLKAWLMNQIGQLAALGYKLEYRPHPKATKFMSHYKGKLFDRVHLHTVSSLERNIEAASVVLTYNSTAGLTSLCLGRRVISSPVAHFHHVSTDEEIYQHMCRVAYSQWTCAELASGQALEFMSQFDKRFIGLDNNASSFVKETALAS